jgi:glycosyltransferase involved in cell wall biosynthesis
LLDAIASVERCDPNLYEIIVVNDGSNDLFTLEVIGRLERDGYHVINQEKPRPRSK